MFLDSAGDGATNRNTPDTSGPGGRSGNVKDRQDSQVPLGNPGSHEDGKMKK